MSELVRNTRGDDIADALECLNRLAAIVGGLGGVRARETRTYSRPLATAPGLVLPSELETLETESNRVALEIAGRDTSNWLAERERVVGVLHCLKLASISRVESFELLVQVRNDTSRLSLTTSFANSLFQGSASPSCSKPDTCNPIQ